MKSRSRCEGGTKKGRKVAIRPRASAFLVMDAEPDRVIIVSS
jgi:hypothetical protein